MERWHFEQTVDLSAASGALRWPDILMVEGDQSAHVWRVRVMDGGSPVSLSGVDVRAYFDRADGVTVTADGSADGCEATVILPDGAYLCPGQMRCTLRARRDGQTVTLARGMCRVQAGPGDAFGGEIPPASAEGVLDRLSKLEQSEGATPVYCWGDSLTQGIGGNAGGWHLMSYPQELSQRCRCVNLGVLSEDMPTIMSRIGADKVTLPACIIPGDHTKGVEIGSVDNGLPTQSGRRSRLIRYGEAGVNPCYVGDVRCILYRDFKADTVEGTRYYLRRFEDGDAVSVEAGTPLVTFGAKHYRGGIHIFWMGANGGYGNLTENGTDLAFGDYVSRLKACVEAVRPENYLIVYARERRGYTSDEDGEKAILSATFAGHFVDLLPAMRDRGLLYAETSLWDGSLTDGVPSVLDSGDGCHFSFYGYKAIAGILWEQLCPMLVRKNLGGTEPAPDGDDFGKWLFKLTVPHDLGAESTGIDTGFAPFAEDSQAWTVAVRVSAEASRGSSNLVIFWLQEWLETSEGSKGLSMCCYADADSRQPDVYMLEGFGGFKVDAESMGVAPSENGYHTYIVTRNGSLFWTYVDGTLIYGSALDYATEGYASQKTLKIGHDGGEGRLIGLVDDVRIYGTHLDQAQCEALYADMNA